LRTLCPDLPPRAVSKVKELNPGSLLVTTSIDQREYDDLINLLPPHSILSVELTCRNPVERLGDVRQITSCLVPPIEEYYYSLESSLIVADDIVAILKSINQRRSDA
jgi:hypothetical protein